MSWIVFGAQYYIMIGEIVDKEKPTSVDGCPAYMNITAINNTKCYSICFLSLRCLLIAFVFRTITTRQPFFIYRISRYYYTLIGTMVTMFAGYLISYFSKDDRKAFRLDLISPLVHFLVPKGKKIIADNSGYYSVEKALDKTVYSSTNEEDVKKSNCER